MTGGNPLNEVPMLANSILLRGGVLSRGNAHALNELERQPATAG
jgi:hypothetical protein